MFSIYKYILILVLKRPRKQFCRSTQFREILFIPFISFRFENPVSGVFELVRWNLLRIFKYNKKINSCVSSFINTLNCFPIKYIIFINDKYYWTMKKKKINKYMVEKLSSLWTNGDDNFAVNSERSICEFEAEKKPKFVFCRLRWTKFYTALLYVYLYFRRYLCPSFRKASNALNNGTRAATLLKHDLFFPFFFFLFPSFFFETTSAAVWEMLPFSTKPILV